MYKPSCLLVCEYLYNLMNAKCIVDSFTVRMYIIVCDKNLWSAGLSFIVFHDHNLF